METISKGENSLLCMLNEEGIDPENYIWFFGLWQNTILNSTPTTEIIYIHSKLMIVDDWKVIIGSANINDWSMLGTRDSEIGCLIEDKTLQIIKMGD